MGREVALVSEKQSNIEAWRASTDAASLCKGIVLKRAINLQGKKYVPVEGWQAIAIAHGCIASSENIERVEGGFRAHGVIRRMSDGAEIARAEGFVGEDEPTWFGGRTTSGKTLPKRPDFAIRAMAQTRGISRACRSAFAHVVVMMDVGLETTPFEEMQGIQDSRPSDIPADTPPTPEPKRARDLAVTDGKKTEGRAKAEKWVAEFVSKLEAAPDAGALGEVYAKNERALAKLKGEYPDLYDRVLMEYRVTNHAAAAEPTVAQEAVAKVKARLEAAPDAEAVEQIINDQMQHMAYLPEDAQMTLEVAFSKARDRVG